MVRRSNGDAGAALIAGLSAGLAALLIHLQKRFGIPAPFENPVLNWREASSLLGALLVLNAIASYANTRGKAGPVRLVISAVPLLNFFFMRHLRRPGLEDSARTSSSSLQLPLSLAPVRWRRKPFLLSRFEKGMASAFIAIAVVPLALLFVGVLLAQHPEQTIEARIASSLQIYYGLIMVYACYRNQTLETRGSLAFQWRLPVWPLALLPWGLGFVAPLALLLRPMEAVGSMAFPLFFDRTAARRDNWLTIKEALPRFRTSNLSSIRLKTSTDSILRSRCCLLTFQSLAIGVVSPFVPADFVTLVILLSGICLAIFLGAMVKNLKPRGNDFHPRKTFIVVGWLSMAAGCSGLGVLIGSALALGQTEAACIYIFFFGTFGSLLSAFVVMMPFSDGLKKFDMIWVLVLYACMFLGGYGTSLSELHEPTEKALVWTGISSWLLFLPIALIYQRPFLEPFTVRDLWRKDLPSETRKRLLPIVLALLMPFGGFANAWLAVASQRRDRLLRLWWKESRVTR